MNAAVSATLALLIMLCCSAAGQERQRPEQLAAQIRIERCEYREASLRDALGHLNRKVQEQLEGDRKFSLEYIGRTPPPDTRMTFSLLDIPLLELLQVIALQTGLELGATADAIYFYHKGEVPVRARPVRALELSWNSRAIKVIGGLIRATARRDSFIEARRILEQSFGGDRFNAPSQGRAALDALQKQIDECEEQISEFERLFEESQTEAEPTNEIGQSMSPLDLP